MLPFVLCYASIVSFRTSPPDVVRAFPSPEPIVLPVERTRGLWVVSAKMAGKPVKLLLGYQPHSALSKKFALDKRVDTRDPVEVTVEGHSLGAAQLAHDIPYYGYGRYDGILGFDILKIYAIGFDVINSTVTIWPGGISASDASAWTLGGTVWPGSAISPKLWSAPLAFDSNGVPSAVVKVGTHECPTELLLSSPSFGLFEPDLVASGALLLSRVKEGGIYAATEIHLGSMGQWVVVGAASNTTKKDLDAFSMPVEVLDSGRVIIDLAGQKIYGQMLDDRSRSAMELSYLFGVPMYLDGLTLRVGPLQNSGEASLSGQGLIEGDEIVQLRGTPAASFADLIRSEGASSLQQVAALYRAQSRMQPTLLTLIQNGKQITLNLDQRKKNGGAGSVEQ